MSDIIEKAEKNNLIDTLRTMGLFVEQFVGITDSTYQTTLIFVKEGSESQTGKIIELSLKPVFLKIISDEEQIELENYIRTNLPSKFSIKNNFKIKINDKEY